MSDEATVLPVVLARRTLSAELAAQSNADIAQALIDAPEGTDFAGGCAVQLEIVNKDPGRWASICATAISLVENPLSILVAALLLERANGQRRRKEWIPAEVVGWLDLVKQIIGRHPNSSRRDRVEELLGYHGALVFYAGGNFKEAAECLRISARFSKDEPRRLWNLYLAAYYELIAVFATGAPGYVAVTLAVGRAANDLKVVLDPLNQLHEQWRLNLMYHEIRMDWYRDFWADDFVLNKVLMAGFRNTLTLGQFPAFMDAQGFVLAIRLLEDLFPNDAFGAAQFVATYAVEPDARADSWLLCALIARDHRKIGDTRACLTALRELKMNGGHLAKAVGARILVDLEVCE